MGYLDGFKITFGKLFEERVTTEYPKEKREKLLTDMVFLAMKKGEMFGPFAKLY